MATIIIFMSITLILLLTSLAMTVFRKYRKSGLRLLAGLILIEIIAAFYVYTPRKYNRAYISHSEEWGRLGLRSLADSLDFYLGCIPSGNAVVQEAFGNNFNSITPENALKMGPLLQHFEIGRYDFTEADKIVDEAISRNLRVRGHTLIWGKQSDIFKSPDLALYLEKYPDNERGNILLGIMENHITTVLDHFKGRVTVWDVVNEPMSIIRGGRLENNVFHRYLGEDYIAVAFRLARNADPGIKLYLNENFLSYDGKQARAFLSLLKKMKADNVPIDGVGIQSHLSPADSSFADLEKFMKSITDLGFEVEITELDFRLRLFGAAEDPYEEQGRYYGRLLSVCLDNPKCRGITFWGFSDNDCWMDKMPLFFPKPNEPYMFDSRMNPKPVFHEFYRILASKVKARSLHHGN